MIFLSSISKKTVHLRV